MVKGLILDVDGTLLDSMGIWMDAGRLFLEDIGYKADDDLCQVMFDLTMADGAKYIQEHYGVTLSVDEIIDGINAKTYEFYKNDAQPKEGVIEFLEYVCSKQIPMVIATTTDRPMIEVAFERLDMHKYFKKIFTTSEVGSGKDKPEIFNIAMKEMGSAIKDTWLFEDAVYSLRNGHAMGLHTVGIYDFSSDEYQDQVKELSEIYMTDWKGYKSLIEKMNF